MKTAEEILNEIKRLPHNERDRLLRLLSTQWQLGKVPYRQNNAQAINDYLIFFDNFPNLTVYPLDRTIAQRAARLRAAYTWLRTPDAIMAAHLKRFTYGSRSSN